MNKENIFIFVSVPERWRTKRGVKEEINFICETTLSLREQTNFQILQFLFNSNYVFYANVKNDRYSFIRIEWIKRWRSLEISICVSFTCSPISIATFYCFWCKRFQRITQHIDFPYTQLCGRFPLNFLYAYCLQLEETCHAKTPAWEQGHNCISVSATVSMGSRVYWKMYAKQLHTVNRITASSLRYYD